MIIYHYIYVMSVYFRTCVKVLFGILLSLFYTHNYYDKETIQWYCIVDQTFIRTEIKSNERNIMQLHNQSYTFNLFIFSCSLHDIVVLSH